MHVQFWLVPTDGETLEEALNNTQVIIQEWIETAKELNRNIPVPHRELKHQTNPSIFDVAEYVLQKTGSITAMALEKLTYYCLAWSLGWYSKSLFPQGFEAWAKGPVNRELFHKHQGKWIVHPGDFAENHNFSEDEKYIMDSVLDIYGSFDAEWLSRLTHFEDPWKLTRNGLSDNASCNRPISNELIARYYGQSVINS